MYKKLQRAVFIDRDGTINEEKEYLYRREDFEFIPGVPESIFALKAAGYLVIVVTNQSGVARGYYGLEDVDRLHEHIQQQLAQYSTSLDAFYVCPHHPEKGQGKYLKDCDCRKGKPGMLLQAAQEYHIDLSQSYIVGDKVADVEAGENAGCRTIMVKTGYGGNECKKLSDGRALVCADLAEAVQYILNNKQN